MSGSLQGCEARSESIADWDGCDQTMAELLRLCSCAPHIISITMSLCNGSFGDSTSPVALPSQGVAFQAIESCRPSRLPDFERGGLMCSHKSSQLQLLLQQCWMSIATPTIRPIQGLDCIMAPYSLYTCHDFQLLGPCSTCRISTYRVQLLRPPQHCQRPCSRIQLAL